MFYHIIEGIIFGENFTYISKLHSIINFYLFSIILGSVDVDTYLRMNQFRFFCSSTDEMINKIRMENMKNDLVSL